MMKSTRSLLTGLAASVAFSAGCAAIERGGPLVEPAPGTTVEVLKPVDFPFHDARRFIQGVETLSWLDINRFAAFCSFGLERQRDGEALAGSIKPGTFTVVDTRYQVRVSMTDTSPVRVASSEGVPAGILRTAMGGGRQGSGTPTFHYYVTEMTLHSGDQPQVDDLTCAYDGRPVDDNLTLDEIRETLADLVRIY